MVEDSSWESVMDQTGGLEAYGVNSEPSWAEWLHVFDPPHGGINCWAIILILPISVFLDVWTPSSLHIIRHLFNLTLVFTLSLRIRGQLFTQRFRI